MKIQLSEPGKIDCLKNINSLVDDGKLVEEENPRQSLAMKTSREFGHLRFLKTKVGSPAKMSSFSNKDELVLRER